MADRTSARRTAANSFFLALHAAVVTVVATLHPTAPGAAPDLTNVRLVAGAGIILALAWWFSLRRYRDLNRAKFRVINALETRLPVAIYSEEWRLLKPETRSRWRLGYGDLGQVERLVPLVFLGLYVLALIQS